MCICSVCMYIHAYVCSHIIRVLFFKIIGLFCKRALQKRLYPECHAYTACIKFLRTASHVTYEWVRSSTESCLVRLREVMWEWCVSHTNESCYKRTWLMSHTNRSCHIQMSYVTCAHWESCQVVSHGLILVHSKSCRIRITHAHGDMWHESFVQGDLVTCHIYFCIRHDL